MLSEKEFINELREMTADWYMFGWAMGMSTIVLNIIQGGGLERYMKEMLEEWLKTGSATWEKLQEALRFIGNIQLASTLTDYKLDQQQRKQLQYCYPCMCTGLCFLIVLMTGLRWRVQLF